MDSYTLDKYMEIHKTKLGSKEDMEFFSNFENRRIAETVCVKKGCRKRTKISTVFLSFDHSFSPGATPILFETMAFSDHLGGDEHMRRYATYEDAVKGHKEVRDKIIDKLNAKVVSDFLKEPAKYPAPDTSLDIKKKRIIPKPIKTRKK